MQEPHLGDAYRFVPSAFTEETAGRDPGGKKDIPRAVTGRIVYINWPHRFFTVAFTVNGVELKESIKF